MWAGLRYKECDTGYPRAGAERGKKDTDGEAERIEDGEAVDLPARVKRHGKGRG